MKPGQPDRMVSCRLDQETFNWVIEQSYLRKVTRGQIVKEAVRLAREQRQIVIRTWKKSA